MNGLTKLSKSKEVKFVTYLRISEAELTSFLVEIKNARTPTIIESADNSGVRGTTVNAKPDC